MNIQQEIDPELHREVFIKTANDVVLRSIPKTNTQLKNKWNLLMKKQGSYDWVVASKIDKTYSKRGGHLRFRGASTSRQLIQITMDGSPINDKRFDASFAKQILASKGLKKQKAIIKRAGKLSKGERNRPRVKILKHGGVTPLHKAFYAKMKSGHEGIFRKKGGKMIELRTITLPSMFKQLDYDALLDTHYKENVTKRYDHYLLQALKKGNR